MASIPQSPRALSCTPAQRPSAGFPDKGRQLGAEAPGHPISVGPAGRVRPCGGHADRGALGVDGPSGAQSPAAAGGTRPGLAVGAAGLGCRAAGKEEGERRLLLVVLFAVQFPIPEVAAGGEGLLTRRALQTLLVPGRLVDSHQEAVGDGPLAALADGGMRAVGACSAQGESRAVSADQPDPSVPAAGYPQPRRQGRGQPGSAARRQRSPGRRARARRQPQLLVLVRRLGRGVSAGLEAWLGAALSPSPEIQRWVLTRMRTSAARGCRVGPAQAR